VTVERKRTDELLAAWRALQFGDARPGAVVRLPVLSGSMRPTLVPGMEIRIRRVSWRRCRVGDIVVFGGTRGLTAHRLLFYVCVRGTWYLFQKGDVNAVGGWIRADRVVGVVVSARRADGTEIEFRSAAARRRAMACACRQLARDLWTRLRVILRGSTAWLHRTLGNAGSA